MAERPLLEGAAVEELATLFGALANDTRLRILHSIARSGEASVSDIAAEVDATTQSVSNHLQRLAGLKMVATRRDGQRIYYRLVDPCIGGVMELGLCLLGHPSNC